MNNSGLDLDSIKTEIATSYNTDRALAETISYDRLSKRYRNNATGQFLSREKALKIEQDFLEKQLKHLESLAPRIKNNEPGIALELAQTLKKIHVTNAIIAANGVDNLTQSDLGRIGATLKKQYGSGVDPVTGKQYGLKFLLKDAPAISEAQLKQRLILFGKSGELSGAMIKENKMIAQGYDIEKRILGNCKHCDDCLRYAAMGWQTIGTLPKPKTQCRCLSNCRCTIFYGVRSLVKV